MWCFHLAKQPDDRPHLDSPLPLRSFLLRLLICSHPTSPSWSWTMSQPTYALNAPINAPIPMPPWGLRIGPWALREIPEKGHMRVSLKREFGVNNRRAAIRHPASNAAGIAISKLAHHSANYLHAPSDLWRKDQDKNERAYLHAPCMFIFFRVSRKFRQGSPRITQHNFSQYSIMPTFTTPHSSRLLSVFG